MFAARQKTSFKPRKRMRRGTVRLERTPFVVKNRKAIKRSYSSRLGTAKPRKGSKRELLSRLESLNARYVKLRDGMECVQCKEEGKPTVGILDAGHLYPKSAFRATKYRVEAIFAQCRYHNMLHCRRPELFLDWYIREHGFDALDAVHAMAVSDWRPSVEWIEETIEERERQIEELQLLAVA